VRSRNRCAPTASAVSRRSAQKVARPSRTTTLSVQVLPEDATQGEHPEPGDGAREPEQQRPAPESPVRAQIRAVTSPADSASRSQLIDRLDRPGVHD
jgi:hypothetical protein